MSSVTITLSSKGQVVIPKEIRDELHWGAGTQLSMVPCASGVMLKAIPKKSSHRFEDLIGMLKHEGQPLPTEDLCKPVDYSEDWEAAEKRNP